MAYIAAAISIAAFVGGACYLAAIGHPWLAAFALLAAACIQVSRSGREI